MRQLPDQIVDLGFGHHVDPHGWLVKDQNGGLCRILRVLSVSTLILAVLAFAVTPSIEATSLGTIPILVTFWAFRSSVILDCFSGEVSVAPFMQA